MWVALAESTRSSRSLLTAHEQGARLVGTEEARRKNVKKEQLS